MSPDPCELCGWSHGAGRPCLVVRVLATGVDGETLGAESARTKVSRRTGRISAARQHERAVTQREAREAKNAQRIRGIKRAAAMRYGLERATQRNGKLVRGGG